MNKNICVFCGASNRVDPDFLEQGKLFGHLLVGKGYGLVYGGGDCGMMGAVANGVLEKGGKATGVFPVGLKNIEVEHKGLTEILIVDSMHERKKLMFDRSEAFVVLPGGFGTLDETFEILTWRQLSFHAKPVILYNYNGYWDPWIELTEHIIANKFATPATRELYRIAANLEEIFKALEGI